MSDAFLRRIERDSVIACAAMTVVALVLGRGRLDYALGVLGGGALIGLSYLAIRSGVSGAIDRVQARHELPDRAREEAPFDSQHATPARGGPPPAPLAPPESHEPSPVNRAGAESEEAEVANHPEKASRPALNEPQASRSEAEGGLPVEDEEGVRPRQRRARPPWFLVKYLTRYALLAAGAYAILVPLRAHPVGVVAGVSSMFIAVVVEAVRAVRVRRGGRAG